jgi:hypothetical protein
VSSKEWECITTHNYIERRRILFDKLEAALKDKQLSLDDKRRQKAMSKDTVLIIIGALFILIGIAGSVKLKDGAVFIKNIWARVGLFIIGIALLILGIFPLSPSSIDDGKPPYKCKNCIVIPPNKGIVSNATIVRGNYSDINNDLWVVVWPEQGGNTGWPQSNDALNGKPATKSNGQWSVTCTFGGPLQSYEIVLYSASQNASEVLSTTMREWANANNYPGINISMLPEGLEELDRITVRKTQQ